MRPRVVYVAWAACAATWLFAMLEVIVLIGSGADLFSVDTFDQGFPVVTLATVTGTTVGAVIVSREPGNRVGWLLCAGYLGTMIGLVSSDWGRGLVEGTLSGSAQLGHWGIWLGQVLGAAYAISLVGVLLLLVPDGRLLSRRWRWVLRAVIAALALSVVGYALIPPSHMQPASVVAPSTAAQLLVSSGIILLTVSLALSAVALVLRLRRARGIERQQLRWITVSAAAIALALAFLLALALVGIADQTTPTYAAAPLYLAYLSIPVATGFAMLRYRLYDVDIIISRAVVLGILVVFVTAGYVTVVVLVGALVGSRAAGRFWPSLLATVVVALAFQPLRRRVSDVADRVVYGERAAPYEELASLSHRLGASLAMSELLPRVAEAAAGCVRAGQSRVQLLVPGADPVAAIWPAQLSAEQPGGDPAEQRAQQPAQLPAEPPAEQPARHTPTYDIELPVLHGGYRVGTIELALRPGQSLARHERRLLGDLAVQCGLAFRNAQLVAAVEARSERLAQDADAIGASRRRLVVAGQSERSRLARAINRDVLPLLVPLPQRIDALRGEVSLHPDLSVQTLADVGVATTDALDALRVITRGVFPAVLARRGVAAALKAQLTQLGTEAVLDLDPQLAQRRYDGRVETAAYFCCLECLQDLDPPIRIEMTVADSSLLVTVAGRQRPAGWNGADHALITDRAEALGGWARTITAGQQVTVQITFPLERAIQPELDDLQAAASRSGSNADLVT